MQTERYRFVFRLPNLPLLFALITIGLLTQPGCLWQRLVAKPEPIPTLFQQTPTQQQLVRAINEQANRIQQLQTGVSLAVDGLPKLKGTLQWERPDRMRLKAGLLGVADLGVDVGSNSDHFWVWVKAAAAGQTPAIFFARHQDYRDRLSQAGGLPVEPQWLAEALGVVQFADTDQLQGPFAGPDGMLQMYTIRQTNHGPLTRMILLDPRTTQIYQQSLYDATGQLIAYSNSSDYRYYADQQVSLPHHVELNVMGRDGQKLKLVMQATEYRLNALYGDPDKMWTMPQPAGVPVVNLADQRDPVSGFQY